jgi:hypothetical protein
MVVTERANAGTAIGNATMERERTTTAARSISLTRIRDLRFVGLVVAGMLLVISLFLPYWSITLNAPQYPMGLTVDAHTHKLTGDVSEVDGLNHYIGMMKLGEAAKIERTISRIAVPLVALLAIGSFFVQGRKRWLLALPAIIYPVVFVADLAIWLYYAGHSLDPTAALSSSIHEFTPRVFGSGTIGQFSTDAQFMVGYYLSVIAALLIVAATVRRERRDAHDS